MPDRPVRSRWPRSSVIIRIWSRNQGSTLVRLARSSTVTPRRRAASSWKGRSGVADGGPGHEVVSLRLSSTRLAGVAVEPSRPCSSERSAFWSDSGKVRPMAIASPTDCICVPSTSGVPGNFSNAQRGTFVTT